MISQLVVVGCILGVVILGLLVMVQAITLTEIAEAGRRVLAFAMGALVLLWFLRLVLVAIVVPWLLAMKAALGWFVLVMLALVLMAILAHVTIYGFRTKGSVKGRSHGGGE